MDYSYERRRKLLSALSIFTVVLLAILLTVFVWNWLAGFSQDGFREYIHSFGIFSPLVLLGLQFLQVFIALIPGELLESAAGYAFGPWLGTLLCYGGVASASALIFYLTRKYGVRLVEVFISREEIQSLRFLNTAAKRNALIFLLYFIPGTPKDLLTYFVGLTDIRFGQFLAISLVARIPSVLTSTFGGHMLGSENYKGAILIYGITGICSIAGLLIYKAILRCRQSR